MKKTAAERQAAYRKKRPFAGAAGDGERNLNTWVSTAAALALARLARHHAVSQREVLERLILAADEAILATLNVDEPAFAAYLGNQGVTA
jgi:hypothetical protein